ncbi:DoxX family protein [Pseudoxanthomonas sp. SL93]|uniref:DoxX family protein n=1 Tax=Pseudoxanthomonas sp. SL93 TaxID=2995142 RepID=UPI002271FD59|nr:DoxX family protein [Pseudoxanthomonas sp. SL93]WAC62469.1 DoxX family protein [Pseudoxanthomonas sp. SL93]
MQSAPLHDRVLAFLNRHGWIGPLLLRLVFGYFWLETGWAKLNNLAFFTERFIEWGIPWPALSATVCAGTEFVGGALIMLGLATRLTMLPMIFNMLVALAVVVLPGISTLDEFVELDEVLYVAVFVWLLFAGPGRASLDHLIARRAGTAALAAA